MSVSRCLSFFLVLTGTSFLFAESIQPYTEHRARIIDVKDGDTVEVVFEDTGIKSKVRLLSIDTPETHFMGKSQGKYGDLASDYLKQRLLPGDLVIVKVDKQPRDRYRRILATIIKDGQSINREMLEKGLAAALFYGPNISDLVDYREAFIRSIESGRSVFGVEVQYPTDFRFEISKGQPEGLLVADVTTKKILPFQEYKQILPENRLFFLNESDVEPTFKTLSKLFCHRFYTK